jgi:hypothetical protein
MQHPRSPIIGAHVCLAAKLKDCGLAAMSRATFLVTEAMVGVGSIGRPASRGHVEGQLAPEREASGTPAAHQPSQSAQTRQMS